MLARGVARFFLLFSVLGLQGALAASQDLGRGFLHHGVAVPVSNHRGTVATVDGRGHNVILSWLNDHRGCYELLLLDGTDGGVEEHPLPFPPGDHPFASILSSSNRFYTHFNSHFIEFDPGTRAFTFFRKTSPQMAMSMTEDDLGVIWSATYPNSGLVSFNPRTRECKDYGSLNREKWAQYPRALAADDAGWIYMSIGSTRGQIVVFDPVNAKAKAFLPDAQRVHGYPELFRGLDGKVYAQSSPGRPGTWVALHKGEATAIDPPARSSAKRYISGSQDLFHRDFPDGTRIKTCDLVTRRFAIEDPRSKSVKTFPFDYKSEGAHIMGLAAAPDGTICGGTAFPMRFFSLDPGKDTLTDREAYGQWNTVARQGERFFVGGYGGGFLLEWDPAQPWLDTVKGGKRSNPVWLTQSSPSINRPHKLLAHPDGRTLTLAGSPGYGYTGGGLLFWDRQTRTSTLLEHTRLLPDHSTMSLVTLPGGKLLGGTTTTAGTGGEKKAAEARLYIMDIGTKEIEWHDALFPGAQNYTDLFNAGNDLVFGFADQRRFFVFDPRTKKVLHQETTLAEFGPTISPQGPRVFISGRNAAIYVLFAKGIARINPDTFKITMLAESPVRISCGGDYLDGRIYFGSGSHLYSYELTE